MSVRFVVDEAGLMRLAEVLALKLKAGDCIALHGDLGAGKTTFARAFIRAVLGDADAEVPSPTFAIEQLYETQRLAIAHYDLYRLASADELTDIGFDERAPASVTLVEWPDRASGLLPLSRLDLYLEPTAAIDQRQVTLKAHGDLASRVDRALTVQAFLSSLKDWHDARVVYLNGDASTRSYARLIRPERRAVLMDAPRQADGPPIRDGKPYSRIAHLAEDVRPFVAVQLGLLAAGLAAPELLAYDLDAGLVLASDLGDVYFGRGVHEGLDQAELWSGAVDVLLALRDKPFATTLALPDGSMHTLPRFDRAALEIEVELLLDWYWPYAKGSPVPAATRVEFAALWRPVLDRMLIEPAGIFLRDFHSPNLFWRPEQAGTNRVGLIDFQDALAEPWAYDLVSLLQDARVDVPRDLEAREFNRYCAAVSAREAAFDPKAFAQTYAAFGAQRNTRLIGLWIRLLQRDQKPGYMQHMPRTWEYLMRNLAHPSLSQVRRWFEQHFPQADRV
jgi:N-acetylmuramate 1-kinase